MHPCWNRALDRRLVAMRPGPAALQYGHAVQRSSVAEEPAINRLILPLTIVALGFNVVLTVVEVLRLPLIPNGAGAGRIGSAALAALVALPLHVRHVLFGLRGQRPPAGGWTLAALAAVNVMALIAVGDAWSFQLPSLAVSILIVLRDPWASLLCGAVIVTPLFLSASAAVAATAGIGPVYLTFSVAFRTVTQFVPVQLVAIIKQVAAAREQLKSRAIVLERIRIDAELRTGVGHKLQHIIESGESAAGIAARDPTAAAEELRSLVAESRRALADARRLVAGYRSTSVSADAHAAARLLEASGARVRVVVDDDVSDLTDAASRRAIHSALVRALEGNPGAAWLLRVGRGRAGLAVSVVPDEDAARKGAMI